MESKVEVHAVENGWVVTRHYILKKAKDRLPRSQRFVAKTEKELLSLIKQVASMPKEEIESE